MSSSSGGVAFQQIGEMTDLREAAGCLGDGAGGGDDFGKSAHLMLRQSEEMCGQSPAV